MPDLGRYASEVLTAYGVTFLLLAVLVGASVVRSSRLRRRLEEEESRRRD